MLNPIESRNPVTCHLEIAMGFEMAWQFHNHQIEKPHNSLRFELGL